MFSTSKVSKIDVGGGVRIAVDDQGRGRPLIFLHGVLMSRVFFGNQRDLASKKHRYVSFDFPGHGDSDDPNKNHTVVEYAKALDVVIRKKKLKDAILVGWSMGVFVAWQYLSDFGGNNVSGVVVIDETPTDFKRDDYDLAPLDLPSLQHFMELTQTDYKTVADVFMSLMFMKEPSGKEYQTLHSEIMKVRPTTAGAILFDQTLRDYRDKLGVYSRIPHLLCFGRDEKLVSVAAAEDLRNRIDGSELVVFEKSGHCPFWEEPEKFNQTIMEFSDRV